MPWVDFHKFDLCLVDDNGRVGTIQAVCERLPANPDLIVLIHDFENPLYAAALPERVPRFVITQVPGPHTAIIGNFGQAQYMRLVAEIEALQGAP